MSAQFKVTESRVNKDLLPGETLHQARDRLLKLWGNFTGVMGDPDVEHHDVDRWVLRADLSSAGFKAFGAEKLVAECPQQTLVYVAPRVGHAPDAIAYLARLYGKKAVFFCPASARASGHQASLLSYPNVELRFVRVAAMPVLNSYAKRWAEENGAAFLPFGLTNTPVVTAGMVRAGAAASREMGGDPPAFFCAVSTGTMVRALQIAWPDAQAYGVAVARNVHDGEIGKAEVISHSLPFLKSLPPEELPPFPSTPNYDAKAWELFETLNIPGSIFINVGSDRHIERNLSFVDVNAIQSQRAWGDMQDVET